MGIKINLNEQPGEPEFAGAKPLNPNGSPEERETFEQLVSAFSVLQPFGAGELVKSVEGEKYERVTTAELTPEQQEELQLARDLEHVDMELTAMDLVKGPEPVLKIPDPVKIKDLPPDRQKAMLEAVNRAAKASKQSVNAVVTELKTAKPPEPSKASSQPVHENEAQVLAELSGLKTPEAPKKKETEVTASGAITDKCTHCGWPSAKPDPEDPTDVDKLNFVQAMLGQIPFRKRYDLLGGALVVEFKSLRSVESDMVWTQTAFDSQAGDILDDGQYFRTLADYRMCLGLASLKVNQKTITLPDSIDDWETPPPGPKATKLKAVVDHIYNNVLKLESVRRPVAMQFFRFQKLIEKLESHVDNSDFWKAIG